MSGWHALDDVIAVVITTTFNTFQPGNSKKPDLEMNKSIWEAKSLKVIVWATIMPSWQETDLLWSCFLIFFKQEESYQIHCVLWKIKWEHLFKKHLVQCLVHWNYSIRDHFLSFFSPGLVFCLPVGNTNTHDTDLFP